MTQDALAAGPTAPKLRGMSETDPAPHPSAADAEARLLDAFWRVVAARGWHGLSMTRLAAASGLSLAEIRRRAPTPLHLLRLHGDRVDRLVLEGTVPGQGGIARDRIFDVLMRRIDALQPHRPGVLRLLDDTTRDPLLALALGPMVLRSMGWMLEAAELDASGAAGAMRAKGLFGVWLATLYAWRGDATEDLGPTMAALDRALDRAEQVARTFRLGPGDLGGTEEASGRPDGDPDDGS